MDSSTPDPTDALGQIASPLPVPSIEEAMAEFREFDVPELKEFLRRNKENVEGLKLGGLKVNRLDRIRENLEKRLIPLTAAYDYLDEKREHGRQHLFLFHVRQAYRGELAALRAKYAPFAISFPVKPFTPTLTAIILRGDELVFRWIETRQWQRQVQAGPNQFVVQSETERSVNFFSVDLATGQAAIRIQTLKPNPAKSLFEELDLYRSLVREKVDLDHFTPLNLEPVVRELLTSNRTKVQRWVIDWPGRGRLAGNVDPGFVEVVLLRFADYVAQELAGDWLFERRGTRRKVRATLDARINEVAIPNRCDRGEEQVILDDIRLAPAHKLHIPALSDLAREHEELRPALETFDVEFAIRGERELDIQKAGGNWVVGPTSAQAAKELASKYPDLFKLRYRVRCPDEKPAQEEKLYETIPATIDCKHKGKKVTHATEGMTETILVFEPPRERPPVIPKVAKAMEPLLPKGLRRRVIGAVTILAFAIVYLPVVFGTAWGFLWLQKRFDSTTGFVFTGIAYSIVLLAELGAVIKLLGNPVTELALKVLLKLASLFRLKSKADQPSKAKVHKVP